MTEGTGCNFTRDDVRAMSLSEAMFYADALSSRRRALAQQSASGGESWLSDEELEAGAEGGEEGELSADADALLSRLGDLPSTPTRSAEEPDE